MSLPRFAKVKLQKDGTVTLWDDEGEQFHLEMRRDQAWPLLTRRARRFELRESIDEKLRERAKPKYEPFSLVKK